MEFFFKVLHIFQGQAQECLLEKSILDGRKDSLIARISMQVKQLNKNLPLLIVISCGCIIIIYTYIQPHNLDQTHPKEVKNVGNRGFLQQPSCLPRSMKHFRMSQNIFYFPDKEHFIVLPYKMSTVRILYKDSPR